MVAANIAQNDTTDTAAVNNSAGSSKVCRLLDIAPELRNHIYRYVISDEDIDIDNITIQQPALLHTCKQIRSEAASIYFLENRFHLDVGSFDPTLMIAFTHQARACVGRKKIKSYVCWNPPPCKWANLLRWLKAYYNEEAEGLDLAEDDHPEEAFYVAAHAFKMIDELKSVMKWDKIEGILELWKDSTVALMQWE